MKNKKDEIKEPIVEEISVETVGQQIALVEKAQSKIAPMANNELEGLKGTKVSLSAQEDIRNAIKVAVIKAHIALKRSFEKIEIRFVIDQLKDEIIRSFPAIRLEEIQLAIHKGAIGEYDKVYNLSLAFFVHCIRSYMNSDARVLAGKKYLEQSAKLELPPHIPTKEEIEKTKINMMLNAFDIFKLKGHYKDYGNYIFNSLVSFGVVNISEADKIEIWKSARTKVINELSNPYETSIDKRNENSKNLKLVLENKEHELIYVEAKKIALNHFFREVKEMDVDLKDLIKL